MKKKLVFVLAVLFIFSFQTQNVTAAWGDYDTSFGFQGALYEPVTDHYPKKVAFQSDGKILVTGYRVLSTGYKRLFLRRYLPSGQIDTSFGSNGSAIIYKIIAKTVNDRGKDIAQQNVSL